MLHNRKKKQIVCLNIVIEKRHQLSHFENNDLLADVQRADCVIRSKVALL